MPKRYKRLAIPILLFILLSLVSLIVGAIGSSVAPNLGIPEWLRVPQPEPRLPAETVFDLFGFPVTNTIIGAWLTIIVLVGLCYAATRRLKLTNPGRGQTVLEFVVGFLLSFCQNVAGEKNGRRFFPIVATIFLFVIVNGWLSLVPGFGSILITNPEGHSVHLLRGANTDVNFPLALALVSFVFVEYFGLRLLGWHYVGKFVNVGRLFRSIGNIFRGRVKEGLGGLFNGFIDIFVGVLETLSEFIRIVSFTFRLFGNMTAGEMLLLIALFLVPFAPGEVFYVLELVVGFVQALVFAGLTLVFVTIAVAPHEAEHAEA